MASSTRNPNQPSSSSLNKAKSTPQFSKYPNTLSKKGGGGGPSKRPIRAQYPSPSIDDVVPSPPRQRHPLPPKPVTTVPVGMPRGKPPRRNAIVQTQTPLGPSIHQNANLSEITPQRMQYHPHPNPKSTYNANSNNNSNNNNNSRAEYSSLQHMLEQAGYKETRVWTPPAEQVRKVKKTFDEVDQEEVEALYSAFGLPRERPQISELQYNQQQQTQHHHVSHTTITEPSLPLKSSSSILRSLAIQSPPAGSSGLGGTETMPSSYESWWGGGIAALGRAAKAVIDMSPPKKSTETSFEEVARMSTGVGLGLAKGGEGVRKARSLRGISTSPDQEDIEPVQHISQYVPAEIPGYSGYTYDVNEAVDPLWTQEELHYPPMNQIDRDTFGYCGLPDDYENQCEEDDELYTTSFDVDVDSLGSTTSPKSRSSSPEIDGQYSIDAAVAMIRSNTQDSQESESSNHFVVAAEYDDAEDNESDEDLGKRIMANTITLDEYESPTKKTWTLPLRPHVGRTATTPAPKNRSPSQSPEPETLLVAETKPTLKYGDRARKLRLAQSTPVLRPQQSGWFDSIKSVIGYPLPSEEGYIPLHTECFPTTSAPAPIRISPIIPAAPALVTAMPVICDSTSHEAEDLPPLPAGIAFPTAPAKPVEIAASSGTIGSIALRLRPSLARLRSVVESAVGIPPVPPLPSGLTGSSEDASGLVLSPRLDWGNSAEHAGWNTGPVSPTLPPTPTFVTPSKFRRNPSGNGENGEITQGGSPEDIDYSKSFFYKPPTPPKVDSSEPSPSAVDTEDFNVAGPSNNISTKPINKDKEPELTKRKSIKSLRAALLIPVAPPAPPVPPIPINYKGSGLAPRGGQDTGDRTPPGSLSKRMNPPLLAILSPGAWEAGLPPRELVLDDEEWRDDYVVGRSGRLRKKKSKRSKRSLRE